MAQSSLDENEGEYSGPVVYLDDIQNKSGVGNQLFATFQAKVKEGLNRSGRISIVDASSEQALQNEAQRRNSGVAVTSSSLFDKVKSLGADYILKFALVSESHERIVPEKSTGSVGKFIDALGGSDPYYKSTISLSVDVVSIKKGTVVRSKTYTCSGNSKSDTSWEDAASKAMDDVSTYALWTADYLSPLSGEILKIESVNKRKTKAETVIVNIGSRKKLRKYEYMYVYTVVDIAGEQSTRQIGELRVKEVLSPNRSLCEVKDGEKEILECSKKNVAMIVKSN